MYMGKRSIRNIKAYTPKYIQTKKTIDIVYCTYRVRFSCIRHPS